MMNPHKNTKSLKESALNPPSSPLYLNMEYPIPRNQGNISFASLQLVLNSHKSRKYDIPRKKPNGGEEDICSGEDHTES